MGIYLLRLEESADDVFTLNVTLHVMEQNVKEKCEVQQSIQTIKTQPSNSKGRKNKEEKT